MKKGKVVIDFEADEVGECSWNITQEEENTLENKDVISLLETVLSELMQEQF